MERRFIKSARVVAADRGLAPAQRWIVAPRGIRPDALALAHSEGLLTSGMRDLLGLERIVAGVIDEKGYLIYDSVKRRW